MLFQFQLRPIEKVAPFGREREYSLSWFGLTDGWYWLKCGDEALFRYADKLINACVAKGMEGFQLPYADYPVVRLWEDILQMINEQQERSTELSRALDRVKNREATPWNEISKAIKYFEEMGYALPKVG